MEQNIPYDDSSSCYESDGEQLGDISEPDLDDLKPDDFIIVEFSTKKVNLVFAGQILSRNIDSDTNGILFEVKFLRREKPTTFSFIFPQAEDILEIAFEQIVGKLPLPQTQGGTSRIARHFVSASIVFEFYIKSFSHKYSLSSSVR